MRYLAPELRRFLLEESKMAFVAGPRQVGKTTLLQHLLAETGDQAHYFNWDIESHRKAILSRPETFWKVADENAPKGSHRLPRLGLDEIHKYPRWKRFLKGFIDQNRGQVHLLVTGSGRLDIYQRGGDSLFGRYGLYRLHPFTLGECLSRDRATVKPPRLFWSDLFGSSVPPGALEGLQALDRLSGFPEPLFSGKEERLRRWRRAHRDLVIREDLRDLTRIRDLGLLDALVSLLPERVGAPLSINNLSQHLSVAFNTVHQWVLALSRLYFLFEIRPFAGRLSRSLRREGKIYLYDYTEIESPGARFENLVALHLLKLVDAWNDWGYGDFSLHYVRNKEKKEVDFLVMEGKHPHLLLETKSSDIDLSPALVYFRDRLNPKFTLQLVQKPGVFKGSDKEKTWILSADRFLAGI